MSDMGSILGDAIERIVREQVERAIAEQGNGWPEWLSVDGAARYMDVSPERVRKLQHSGVLPYSQEAPGTRVHFRRRDLDALLDGWRR